MIRYANGRRATGEELELIARAFGFSSRQQMDRACQEGDVKRRARKAREEAGK